jgi:hypothetical protein
MSQSLIHSKLGKILFQNINQKNISSRFNFDTYKLVRQLERNGFSRGQSVAMMRTINAFLVDSTLSLRQELIGASDLENVS